MQELKGLLGSGIRGRSGSINRTMQELKDVGVLLPFKHQGGINRTMQELKGWANMSGPSKRPGINRTMQELKAKPTRT